MNPQTIQLGGLARYYYDVIAAFTHKGGRHLHDISNLRTGAILTDLSFYFPDLHKIIDEEQFIISLPQVSLESVSNIVRQATKNEESADNNGEEIFSEQETEPTNEVSEKRRVAESLLAMYRKQESDPYNRETLVGFQIVAGTYGAIRYCAPLFYFPVRIEWEPLNDIIRLVKQTRPSFNTALN